ncbi:MAG: thiol reductant ABC exporter subunit CydC [Acidisphaera sp.]|nr:thiol reductant ABC exporter subunit CydC [Acidisphaera sp.]
MKPLWRVLGLSRARWPWLALGLAVSLASVAAGMALLAQAGATIAAALAGGVLAGGVLLRVLGTARVVLRYTERLVTHDATFRALADLRVWFFRGLAARSAGGLGFRRTGDVLSRLVNDVDALDGLYLRILVPLAAALLALPVLVGVTLALTGPNERLLAAWLGLLLAAAALAVPASAARTARAGAGRLATASAGLRVATLDALTGLREVRAFGGEGRMLAAIQARQAGMLAAQRDLARRSARAGAVAFLCGQAALLGVLIAAGAGGPAMVAVAFLTVAAFEAVGGLPRAGALAGHISVAARRVLDAAEGEHPLPDPRHPAAPPAASGLRFEAVRFRWQPDRPAVFDGLTLDVPQGTRVAILGPSGAGKSSLAALALKVVAPQSGRVLLGGVDVAGLAAADVRARIAWLGQATHLFADTIRANLLLGRPDADEPVLWAALEAARVAEVVRALPDRLDAWVGEAGANFSGGQGRRLALARALLSPAPLLILDEPCAGLDAETERSFYTALNETAQGRTIVLIAHRLTGAERLDRIWRLSAGRAVAAAA